MAPKRNLVVLFLVLSSAAGCWAQGTQEKKPTGCVVPPREQGSTPAGPFKFLPEESYKNSPVVKFQINEGGTVSNVKLVRSSGVRDIDKKLLDVVAKWKFKARPGCGTIETEMSLTIDFL